MTATSRLTGLFFVGLTVALTVYGQMAVRWQLGKAGEFPADNSARLLFLARMVLNPWVLSAFAAAFLASISWIVALTQLELNFAYPFTSLSIVAIMFLSYLFFSEPLTVNKLAGTLVIVLGIIILTR